MRRPSFDSFALALGVHASTVTFVAVAATTETGFLDVSSVVAAVVVFVVVAGVATTRTNLVVWTVERRLQVLLTLVPTTPLFAIMIADSVNVVTDGIALTWIPYALLPALTGLVVFAVAQRRYEAYLREHERVLAEWTAVPDARYRRVVRVTLFAVCMTLIIGGFVAALTSNREIGYLPAFGGALLGYAFVAGRTKRYTLFESGLVIRASGAASGAFVPIRNLRSVTRSERALTVYRGLPWPFPIRCSISSLENPHTVESALRERLG